MRNLHKEFSEVYNKYVKKIYRFVFFKVNSREVAQDLTSETFLRTWNFFQEGKIKNVRAFLYKTALNLITDYYRQKGRVQFVSSRDPLPDPRQDLLEKAKNDSDVENMKEVLSQLSPDYQNVLIWYYLDGLSIAEMSELLNRTEGATRVLLHRALRSLKEKIEEV